jgi:EAL domain-containing protein (putative c-di-GMP-specific phosphodiesterase class I)
MPGVFMPVAEQSELMNDIGRWVLRNGCHQLRLWDEAGMPALRLAVNLSAAQFADPRLSRNIGDALDAHGVAWDRLKVEMTETAVMGNRDKAARVFHDLRALGVTVAIDDFGTGYSTMGQLKDLPFDTMKIDREFVHGVDTSRESQAICRALIELAKGLDIAVLAEGVEVEGRCRPTNSQPGFTTRARSPASEPLPIGNLIPNAAAPFWRQEVIP